MSRTRVLLGSGVTALAVAAVVGVPALLAPTAQPTAGQQAAAPAPTQPAAAAAVPTSPAPTATPDRIVLNPDTDLDARQTVTWRTSTDVTAPQAQISPDTADPWGFKTVTVKASRTTNQQADGGYSQAFHTATFEALKPGTTYLYRVGDGSIWSPWLRFTTGKPAAPTTSLIAMGDIQTGIRSDWSRVALAAYGDRPQARGLISVGDHTNTFNNDAQWDELLDAAAPLSNGRVWMPAIGNHEYRSTDSGELTPQFRAQFPAPANGPTDFPQFAGTTYYTDIDNVRVVTLNSYYRVPADKKDEQRWLDSQARWMESILANNPREFTIVNFHYPVYSSSPDRANPELRNTWQPIFEKYGVDLVLQGHDHAYVSGQRDVRGRNTGPVYVTSSSSIRQYPQDYSDWTKNGATPKTAYQSLMTYQLIDLQDRTLTYTAKDSTGRITDQWTVAHRGNTKQVKHIQGIGVQRTS
ncbi:purple acid phosphatase family protein [Nakamurella aerolata]|uniref:Metallophosphoesterase family protein n=1 Tax=Nakamurella aerolata TaxID=1656892 RepID=A0A849AJU2_9ACTN|nr:metallophosphoesterase family protein [Nakamurella aerolata]NNG37092.1 metallophosphoesterase family protein [Nakamurella aerolata]